MKRKNGIAVLQTRIEKELREIKKVVECVEKNLAGVSHRVPDDFTVGGFAGYLNSFYNGLENIFRLIAEYVDEYEPRSEGWHKDLLHDFRPLIK